MNVGIVGLGRMGAAIALRAHQEGFPVIGFDPDRTSAENARQQGISIAASLDDLARNTDVIWIMVPAGQIVDSVIEQLTPHLRSGAIIIDGGNSKFTDSIRRAASLARNQIAFVDCGTSGGIHGKEHGFCLMVGGELSAYQRIEPLLKAVAAPQAYAHVGPSGAGHYVKMVHNGIEYGLMQAYAEGFHILKEGSFKDAHLDLETISGIWMHGSVIRSWLLELSHQIFTHDQQLKDISGVVAESGMGKWTIEDAQKHAIPAPVIADSLKVRVESANGGNFATKLLALLRNAFGGHSFGTTKSTVKKS